MSTIASRHQTILNKLEKEGAVQVLALCKELKVSAVTIRKDLKLLEDKGLLFRSHGGASRTNPYINERPVNEKEHIRTDEKDRIGKAAAAMVDEDNAIIIASGTTVLALARHIKPRQQLIAITASLNVALELNKHKEVEVLQLGGTLRKSSFSITGPYGENMLTHFSCNKLFLGIDGLDMEFGLTTTSLQEAHLNQKMMAAAQKIIVLADSSKFGRRGFGRICGLEDIDQIITDTEAPEHYVRAIKEREIEIIQV